jgi:hypothetical protein
LWQDAAWSWQASSNASADRCEIIEPTLKASACEQRRVVNIGKRDKPRRRRHAPHVPSQRQSAAKENAYTSTCRPEPEPTQQPGAYAHPWAQVRDLPRGSQGLYNSAFRKIRGADSSASPQNGTDKRRKNPGSASEWHVFVFGGFPMRDKCQRTSSLVPKMYFKTCRPERSAA